MQKIKLWSVESSGSTRKATAVADIDTTETEQQLEDLLVNSPDLLMDNLTLVGRQLPTEGGPLDLLGVDADGRLVLFELKRGTLTRDAVAQALDYASDLAVLGEDKFARLIDEHSGQNGIEAREGFADWYQQEFPNEIGLLTNPPKIVLVGLGADERARRIVNFLAQRGIEIQLLTFHGFTHEGKLFLARQVESIAPTPTRNSATKESNQAVLHEAAEQLGVKEFLEEVASFIEARMPGYRWPGKTAYSFSLQEKTSEGRPHTAFLRHPLPRHKTARLSAPHSDAESSKNCRRCRKPVLRGCFSGCQEPEKLQRPRCQYVQRRMDNDVAASRAAAFSDSRWLEAKRGRRREKHTL